MSNKISSKQYTSNSKQIIKIIYLSEMAEHCYKLHLENNQNKKKWQSSLVKQLQNVSRWPDQNISGWIAGFKNAIQKHLNETITTDVGKLLIVKKSINKTKNLLDKDENKEIANCIKLYGNIYNCIKDISLEIIGNTNHLKEIKYSSKKELNLLLNNLNHFFENDIELPAAIAIDIWNNQKQK